MRFFSLIVMSLVVLHGIAFFNDMATAAPHDTKAMRPREKFLLRRMLTQDEINDEKDEEMHRMHFGHKNKVLIKNIEIPVPIPVGVPEPVAVGVPIPVPQTAVAQTVVGTPGAITGPGTGEIPVNVPRPTPAASGTRPTPAPSGQAMSRGQVQSGGLGQGDQVQQMDQQDQFGQMNPMGGQFGQMGGPMGGQFGQMGGQFGMMGNQFGGRFGQFGGQFSPMGMGNQFSGESFNFPRGRRFMFIR